MTALDVVNLRGLVTGRLGDAPRDAEGLRCEDGRIVALEPGADGAPTLDAGGAVAIPGLIDSHAHVVFGDWTPRQSALGWIASSLHGGVTTMMSASEVHLPGRPHDAVGVKALARAAQQRGFVVMNHTGGASIPGSSPVPIEAVLALGCDIIGHANGGTTALPDADLPQLFHAPGAIQLVQAGNLRSSLRILELARARDALDRIVLATDTPTGTGVMPLAMIKTVCELSSLGGLPAADVIAMATGANGRVLRRPEGVLGVGRPADFALLHAPLGCAFDDPLLAIEHGDIPGIGAVVVDGRVQALRSRNTPAPSGECRLRPALEESLS